MLFKIEHIEVGDSVKWEWDGKQHWGAVTQKIGNLLFAKKPEDAVEHPHKEWVLNIREIINHEQRKSEVHL